MDAKLLAQTQELIRAATAVANDAVADYKTAYHKAETSTRKNALAQHPTNPWLYFADPAVLRLLRALNAMGEE